MRSETFARCLQAFSDSGNVADDDAVENAVSNAGAMAGIQPPRIHARHEREQDRQRDEAVDEQSRDHAAGEQQQMRPAPANPETATTFAISANTPMGASIITQPVMRIMIWKMPCQKLMTVPWCGCSMRARKKPNSTEKNTSASSLVLTAASTMLDGTIPLMVSSTLVSARALTPSVTCAASAVSASVSPDRHAVLARRAR